MSVEQTLRLDGRTALVTGASRGIGRQAALTLAAAGAKVVLAARSAEDLGEVAAAARRAGAPDAVVAVTDVLDEAAVEAAVASIAGFTASPGIGAYGAAKAGVIALTRTLAVEAAAQGVRVNCLAPGWVRTELTRRMWSDPETSRALVAQVPLGRWADVEELAGPLLLLASDAGSYITGATLVVDGGLLA